MALRKTSQDIAVLRRAGDLLKRTLAYASERAIPGKRLIDLDADIEAFILAGGGTPSFKGFEGFPCASCLSMNDEVVHGIPDQRILMPGDVLGIDVGIWLEKRCVDAAVTIVVGGEHENAAGAALIEVTRDALMAGIHAIKPYRRVGAISAAVQGVAEAQELGIVRALTGHGVGHAIHEAPEIPNYGRATDGMLLQAGMVLAVEPMLTLGSGAVITDVDGWTIRTKDGSLAAQIEHTVLVTDRGYEILT
jgi:methionyl aminopeptidase